MIPDRAIFEERLIDVPHIADVKPVIDRTFTDLLGWLVEHRQDGCVLNVRCQNDAMFTSFFFSGVDERERQDAVNAVVLELMPQFDAHFFWEDGQWASDV